MPMKCLSSPAIVADGSVTAGVLADALAAYICGTPSFNVQGLPELRAISVQMKDIKGNSLAGKHLVRFWLSSAPAGAQAVEMISPSLSIDGGMGVIQRVMDSGKDMFISTTDVGLFSVILTTGTGNQVTVYANVEYQGRIYSSTGFLVNRSNT